MKLLNLFSVVTLIGTTWLLTGCGDSDSKVENIEPCPESYVMNNKTNTCEPKDATIDDSTTQPCPNGLTWSISKRDREKCIDNNYDNLVTLNQQETLERLKIEYPIDDLTGLYLTKTLRNFKTENTETQPPARPVDFWQTPQ